MSALAFDAATMIEAFARTVAEHGDVVALRDEDGRERTWAQWDAEVDEYAAGLAARGIGPGDSVAFLLGNRSEAYALDMAVLHTGACCYGIYATSSPEQIAHQVRVAETRILVAETAFGDRARAAAALADGLEVFLVDVPTDDAASVTQLAIPGGRRPAVEVTADDVATLIFTSGTTGPPKAAELTHGAVMEELRICQVSCGLQPLPSLISYLPPAHVADRVFAYYFALVTGGTISFVADPRQFVAALPRIRPQLLLSVPRMWDKLSAAIAAAGRAADADFDAVLQRSLDSLRAGDGFVDAPPLAAMRERFGLADVHLAMSGSAPLDVETLRFLMALGLPFSEGTG